ncbi:MAG TPA: leucine--tRNA ligase [Streptosporangiaceae bacterium]|nr:leucine--tRNA ligase [Streptosporangiaceae bacterium]
MSNDTTGDGPPSVAAARPVTAAAPAASANAAGLPPYRYDARLAEDIELRWQEYWAAAGTFESPNPSGPLADKFQVGQPKVYVLDMFPYASGTGIHVGHPEGYIATDVYARYLRMTGQHVLHAMGFDSFGLPAEQFALSTGQHPRVTTRRNTDNMRQQLRRLGLGHDARRSVDTTDPGFYRWTQWIFLKIFDSWVDERTGRARPIADLIAEFESGQRAGPGGRDWAALTGREQREAIDARRLAYVAEEPVNWCPGLGTVLANEEVTADGRSDIGNFPVHRRPLRQWMMRITAISERLIDDLDELAWPESVKQLQRNWIGASDGAIITLRSADRRDVAIDVFTTRPDTLYGATFVVLAPEHQLVDTLATDSWPGETPPEWRRAGPDPRAAIIAYRDATAHQSDRQRAAGGGKTGVFTGAHAVNPMTGDPVPIFVASYVLMGYGTGAIMAVPAHDERDLDFARAHDLPVRQVIDADGRYADVPGVRLAGLDTLAAIAASIQWLEQGGHGHATRRYRLRDWLFSRQRYWGEPFPIVYGADGLPVPLPESALPVLLPELTDFRPEPGADEPVPPLARATDWATVELDLGDGVATYRRELNTMPQWAGSCWYYLRYLDPANETAFVAPDVERYWMEPGGVDLYIGGVEHAVLHLLYARFWHKVLYDLGLVSTPEPFARLVNQGMIQADAYVDDRGMYVPAADVVVGADGSPSYRGRPVTRRSGKMGKSLKNGVSPEEMYRRYGADTLRLYEMAIGPLEVDKPWRTDDVVGVHRFLQRLWRCLVDERTGELTVTGAPLDAATLRALHATIASVRRDFGLLRFNTAIARLMELVTVAARLSGAGGDGGGGGGRGLPRALAEPLVLMIAPLAPHIAEELWAKLGYPASVAYAAFPEADLALAQARTITLPVQVNGRTRFRIEVPAGLEAADVEAAVRADAAYGRWTAGMSVERLIVVPDRIVNVMAAP